MEPKEGEEDYVKIVAENLKSNFPTIEHTIREQSRRRRMDEESKYKDVLIMIEEMKKLIKNEIQKRVLLSRPIISSNSHCIILFADRHRKLLSRAG